MTIDEPTFPLWVVVHRGESVWRPVMRAPGQAVAFSHQTLAGDFLRAANNPAWEARLQDPRLPLANPEDLTIPERRFAMNSGVGSAGLPAAGKPVTYPRIGPPDGSEVLRSIPASFNPNELTSHMC